jgi:hypothetical protein
MTALALARDARTLDDVLRAALRARPAPLTGRGRRREPPREVECVVCGHAATRDRDGFGGHVTACASCGSVLEEPAAVQLALA